MHAKSLQSCLTLCNPRTGEFKSYFTPPPEMKAHSPGGGSLGWEKDKNTDGDM